MRVSFHPDYRIDLPPPHPFPMGKYPLLHARLLAGGVIAATDVMEPEEAALAMLARVHTADYLERLATGTLSPADRRRLGVPLTPRLWRRSRLAVHGTWLAARAALADGLAGNLAGGTHHAFAGHGEGFCVLNDVAVAIRALQADGSAHRALVVDLDVHQGNGTAAIFAGDAAVYTLSLHGERNYPLRKSVSTRDVGLADGTDDEAYLAALSTELATALAWRPDIVFYVAGVDVLAGDHYGRLALTEAGLRRREQHVVAAIRDAGLPLVIVLGGGYAPTTLRTAELHAIVFEAAAMRWRAERQR
jgi:acetoin utilization deacetylase AcuC-like enzyme